MQVRDLMLREVIKVFPSTTLGELLRLFKHFHTLPVVPVVDEEDHLIGVVSLRSLVEVLLPRRPEILKTVAFLDEEEGDIFSSELTEEMRNLIIVRDLTGEKIVSVPEEAPIEKAYQLMRLHNMEQLFVVDKANRLMGIIGMFDIISHLFKERGVYQ